MKRLIRGFALALALVAAPAANAATVYSGSSAIGATVDPLDARAAWEAAVGSFAVDSLDGLSGTSGVGGNLTTALGNTFTTSNDSISAAGSRFEFYMPGTNLDLRGGNVRPRDVHLDARRAHERVRVLHARS